MMNYKLLELVKENPSLPIVPMTHYEVCAGDSGYWLGEIESIEIREYTVNEWNEDDPVLFRDEPGAEERLIESIAEYKYDGTKEDYDKAEIEAKEMWTKAIIFTSQKTLFDSLIRTGMNVHELPGSDKVPVYHIQNQIFAILT